MDRDESLDKLFREYDAHSERLEELGSNLRSILEEVRQIDADEQRIVDELEVSSDEDSKATLLFAVTDAEDDADDYMSAPWGDDVGDGY